MVALAIQYSLKRLGYSVAGVAASADEAVRLAEESQPDLILMDILLKGPCDGVEAAAVIGLRHKIPVIFLSSLADEETLERAKVTEAFGYLVKPFEDHDLHAAIQIALYKHQAERRARETEPALQRARLELEQRLRERTAALNAADQALQAERVARRATEQTLAHNQALVHGLFEHAPDAILIVDAAGCLVRVNEQVCTLFGYSSEQLSGQKVEVLLPERFRERHVQHREHFMASPQARRMGMGLELFGLRRDGSEFPVHVSLGKLPGDQGMLLFAVVHDITEYKKLEARFRMAQKMEAIGRLAGGVAHDFNNLLTIITGYTEMLLHRMNLEEAAAGTLRQVLNAADRAAALTHQLLAFSRKQVLLPRILDLNAVVAGLEKMLCRLIDEDIRLTFLPGQVLHPVKADRCQLEQVLLTLTVNARDAMPNGGRLTIATGNIHFDDVQKSPRPEMPPGAYVMLAVSDTGRGMDALTLARLFEPFFTTQEMGKGTGLGLATVYGIIKQSGGFIYASSVLGRGTSFTIYLPAVLTAAVNPVDAEAVELPRGTETILLVEDEEAVRLMARQALESCGYTILEASHGLEALRTARRHPGSLDLVLTDVVMPELSGPEMARQVVGLRRGVKVLFMTGYPDDRTLVQGLYHAAAPLLQKPFAAAVLSRRVRQVLDEPSGNGQK
jgi:PAS domain S-box-containing protein